MEDLFGIELPDAGVTDLLGTPELGVDLHSGAATLTLPVPTTPGRTLEPALALEYRSSGGNSPFGVGWDLSGVAAVTLGTARSLPRYDGTDGYSYLGQELVPALADDGAGPGRRTAERDGFQVQFFRATVERRFQRFERWVDPDGHCHWRVRDTEGTVTIFGLGADGLGRITDPDDCDRVYAWLPEARYDRHGNALRLEYVAEDRRGVDRAAACERSHVRRGELPQRYLKRVRYANTLPADEVTGPPSGNRWLLEVVLDYGDHAGDIPGPTADLAWPVRTDPYSTCRPGFELRTYRLCRRMLQFHHFEELGAGPTLVGCTSLAHSENPAGSTLTAVTRHGFRRSQTGYATRSLPSVRLRYTEAAVAPSFVDTTRAVLAHGTAGTRSTWVDLRGEGLPGLLTEAGGAWYFRRNEGGGQFGRPECVASMPAQRRQVALTDFDGDGNTDAVIFAGRLAGSWGLDRDTGAWSEFRPFDTAARLESLEHRVEWLDLDGDGRAEPCFASAGAVTWHPSKGRHGYGPARAAPASHASAPPLAQDPRRFLFLADMNGDGLVDQVRIANGRVEYWPQLGNGRFGEAVLMDGAPVFAADGDFDPARLRLVDLDGSGTADIVYLGRGELRWWVNAGGNRLLDGGCLRGMPYLDNLSDVAVLDLLGDGPCLVWSSPLASGSAAVRYLPLTRGIRGRLLASMDNSLGREVRLSYGSSATHYLRDRRAGRGWRTLLPSHPIVVDRREDADHVSGRRVISRYEYHDGCFDDSGSGFAGFALVDRFDGEPEDGDTEPVTPVCVRTWMHTGEPRHAAAIADAYAGDPLAPPLATVVVDDPDALEPGEYEAALRCVAGEVLRQETYAVRAGRGRAAHPVTVTQVQFRVKRLQRAAPGRPVAFTAHASNRLTYDYEQDPDDPRVSQQVVLAIDRYGVTEASCSVAYPRRTHRPAATAAQTVAVVTAGRNRHAWFDTPERYEVGIPVETTDYQLSPAVVRDEPMAADLLADAVLAALVDPLAPHEHLDPAVPAARVLGRERSFYWDAQRLAALPHGQVGPVTLVHHEETGCLTDDLVARAYDGRVDATWAARLAYVRDGAWWWQRDPVRLHADRTSFNLPAGTERDDGASTALVYDQHRLAVVSATDAVGNQCRADLDYHSIDPYRVVDPNGSVREVRYDPLGVAVARTWYGDIRTGAGGIARYGHEPLAAADHPGGSPDGGVGSALAGPAAAVGQVAEVVCYDLSGWERDRTPARVLTVAREALAHRAGIPGSVADGGEPVGVSLVYLDGGGSPLQVKQQVEAGPAVARGPDGRVRLGADGRPMLAHAVQRWLVSGLVSLNAAGAPAREYQPFFSDLAAFEPGGDLSRFGACRTVRYDAVGRPVRVDEPTGSHTLIEYGAWRTGRHDANDTVEDSLYKLAREGLPETDPERVALRKARAHAGTPTVDDLDPLGRVVRQMTRTGAGPATVQFTLDARGDPTAVIDPRGLTAVAYLRDLCGRPLRTVSVDTGTSWTLMDGFDRPAHHWDAAGVHTAVSFDLLDRQVELSVAPPASGPRVDRAWHYGDDPAVADVEARHLRGRLVRCVDQAGVLEVGAYDPAGGVLRSERRLCENPDPEPDWAEPAAVVLETQAHVSEMGYDALGRPVWQRLPDGAERGVDYLRSGGVARIRLRLPGEAAERVLIDGIAADARGGRLRARLGNGIELSYSYDPDSGRLAGASATTPATAGRPERRLLDLAYTYDPVGNVVRVADWAQEPDRPTALLSGATTSPHAEYTYDPAYRLIEATGRVHQALLEHDYRPGLETAGGFKGTRHLTLDNGQAVERYVQTYGYDLSGNLTWLRHAGTTRSWTTEVWQSPTSNRGLPARDPNGQLVTDPDSRFDAAGNCRFLPHLCELAWGTAGGLRRVVVVDRQGTGQPDDDELYAYDSAGQRLRRVTRRLVSGTVETTETLYLDGCEIVRVRAGGQLRLERVTSHVDDGAGRVASVHRWTIDLARRDVDATPATRVHFPVANHVGSAVLETGEDAAVISYEEFFPYGGSAFIAGDSRRDVTRKDYRYAGKERDAATGLYYFGHRYYAPWIGRWLSPDPTGPGDSLNLYQYARDNPVTLTDPNGLQAVRPDAIAIHPVGQMPAWTLADKLDPKSREQVGVTRFPVLKPTGALVYMTKEEVLAYVRASNRVVVEELSAVPEPEPQVTSGEFEFGESEVEQITAGEQQAPEPDATTDQPDPAAVPATSPQPDQPAAQAAERTAAETATVSKPPGAGQKAAGPGTGARGTGSGGGGTGSHAGAGDARSTGVATRPDGGGQHPGAGRRGPRDARPSGRPLTWRSLLPGTSPYGSSTGELGGQASEPTAPAPDSTPKVQGVDPYGSPDGSELAESGRTGSGAAREGDGGRPADEGGRYGRQEPENLGQRLRRYAGYLNFEFHAADPGLGHADGVPGGMGSGTWGGNLYTALSVLSLFTGAIKSLVKGVMKIGVKALLTKVLQRMTARAVAAKAALAGLKNELRNMLDGFIARLPTRNNRWWYNAAGTALSTAWTNARIRLNRALHGLPVNWGVTDPFSGLVVGGEWHHWGVPQRMVDWFRRSFGGFAPGLASNLERAAHSMTTLIPRSVHNIVDSSAAAGGGFVVPRLYRWFPPARFGYLFINVLTRGERVFASVAIAGAGAAGVGAGVAIGNLINSLTGPSSDPPNQR